MEVGIIFLVVFIPFVFIVWKMLSFTKNTVGENSPFVISKTYKPTHAQFGLFDLAYILFLLFYSLVFIGGGIAMIVQWENLYLVLGILFIVAGLFMLFAVLSYGIIGYNHRDNDKKYTITLVPEGRKVVLENQNVTFISAEIATVKYVTNENTRMQKSYYAFSLTNGFSFTISGEHPVWEVLDEFLKIPKYEVHKTFLPLIEGSPKWSFLENIYATYIRIFDRRFLKEIFGLVFCILTLNYLLSGYKQTQSWENSLRKEEVVIVNKEMYRSGKTNAYNLWIDYKGKLYRHHVTSSTYNRYPKGNKIELKYDAITDNFYSDTSKDNFVLLVFVGVFTFFLLIRIIYLIVFPKSFH